MQTPGATSVEPVGYLAAAIRLRWTALLFNVGKSLIGLYLAKSSVDSGFGAAGSVVILVAWFYYSAQIFLFGAECTWVYANSKAQNG